MRSRSKKHGEEGSRARFNRQIRSSSHLSSKIASAGSPPPNEAKKYSHIPDKKLRAELSRQSAHSTRSKALLEDAAFLLEHEESGTVIEAEGELERDVEGRAG
jgi:U3 small nucleolar RNA-associated protein 7